MNFPRMALFVISSTMNFPRMALSVISSMMIFQPKNFFNDASGVEMNDREFKVRDELEGTRFALPAAAGGGDASGREKFFRLAAFMIFQTGSIHDSYGVAIFMIVPGWPYSLSFGGQDSWQFHGFTRLAVFVDYFELIVFTVTSSELVFAR